MGNNIYGITAARLADPESMTEVTWEWPDLVLLGVSALAFVWSLGILVRAPRGPAEDETTVFE